MKKQLRKLKTLARRIRPQDGFTLLETIITAVVLAIGIVAVLALLDTNNNLSRQSKNLQAATKFAQSQLDYYRSLGYSALSAGTTDVTSSMPSSLSGTAASCSSGTAKSACITISGQSPTVTLLDSSVTVGISSDIAVPSDGLPVISYGTSTNSDLKVLKCGNAACSSGNTITTVESTGDIGADSSIAISGDGLPVVSYYDATNGDLKVVKCGNAACSSGNTITTVDSTAGQTTSIIVASGLPLISYYDKNNGDLKVAKCGNAACSSGNTITTVDSTGDVGAYTASAVGNDGLAVISYRGVGLKVLKCGNAACNSGNTITTVDSTSGTGPDSDIAIGTDGLPLISYIEDYPADNLKVAKCGNAACSSGNTITNAAVHNPAGGQTICCETGITIANNGYPVISFYRYNPDYDLKILSCGNAACSSGNTESTIDSAGDVGPYSSVAIGSDGLPVVAYEGNGTGLKAAQCGSADCIRLPNAYTVSIIIKYLEGKATKTVRMSEVISRNGLGS